MVREKTVPMSPMLRVVLGIFGVSSLFVAADAATTPPNLAKALAAQQEQVAARPHDPEVHNDHGNLLMLAGRMEEASSAYRRAIEIAPDSALPRFNLGVLLQQSGRWRQAMAEYKNVLEIEPRHARTFYQLGMLFESRNQRAKAVEHYARAFISSTTGSPPRRSWRRAVSATLRARSCPGSTASRTGSPI